MSKPGWCETEDVLVCFGFLHSVSTDWSGKYFVLRKCLEFHLEISDSVFFYFMPCINEKK